MISIRLAEDSDRPHLTKWLYDPNVLRWFPMCNEKEVDDAVRVWMSYVRLSSVLTALYDGEPAGMANLYVSPYKKLSYQSLFAIIVAKELRGKGIGTALLQELMKMAKERFQIELLHLEVYENNPAMRLYQRCGFIEYGRHEHFLKEDDHFGTKILMQKRL